MTKCTEKHSMVSNLATTQDEIVEIFDVMRENWSVWEKPSRKPAAGNPLPSFPLCDIEISRCDLYVLILAFCSPTDKT